MKIAFIWQQSSHGVVFNRWNDGLRAAMRIIEGKHDVAYFEPFHTEEILAWKPDIALYWEAPCTINGANAQNYISVLNLPFTKALLFAGGPITEDNIKGFDYYFVESEVNEREISALHLPVKRAFGVNTKVFKPEKQPRVFDGMHHATFAGWKRQHLLAEALGNKALLCGRYQPTDTTTYEKSIQFGPLILPEVSYETVASLINASVTVVNTSDKWGGGQRCTLEAMASGTPPIVMTDSLKNREYVEEANYGFVCDPDPNIIKKTVELARSLTEEERLRGVEYIQNKWTEQHYADNLLEVCLNL